MAFLKTPLRYPGGKSRAIKKIAQFFPDLDAYTEYREPFLGGGSVAIYITLQHPTLDVWVNDLYEPLYTFWKQLQLSGEKLRDELLQLKERHPDPSSARNLFNEAKEYLQKNEWNTEPFHKAVSFYIANKCSFSGLTENASFSKMASDQNFTITGIDNLPYYSSLIKKWHITNLPFEKCMTDDPYAFIYLDPPYAIKDNLYGFDSHNKLLKLRPPQINGFKAAIPSLNSWNIHGNYTNAYDYPRQNPIMKFYRSKNNNYYIQVFFRGRGSWSSKWLIKVHPNNTSYTAI